MKTLPRLAAFAAATLLLAPALAAQSPLPVGRTAEGTLSGGKALYAFSAKEAGFLTLVVRASAGEDLSLSVSDAEGQVVPDGTSDADLGGEVGSERFVVALSAPGSYVVAVRCYEETASFQLGASFLPSQLASSPDDPDGRPSGAVELPVGGTRDDAIDPPSGDRVDWYRIPIAKDGVLTVFTRAEGDGDLKLERYVAPDFGEPKETADEDRDGVMGNESLTLDVKAGDVILLRVVPAFWGAVTVKYRIATGLIAG